VIEALIFDCDGVLADTERDCHLPAFNAAFADLGLAFRWTDAEYGELLSIGGGKERLRTIPARHPEAGFPEPGPALDELVAKIHLAKTERYIGIIEQGVVGRPGVRRLIEEAVSAGVKVAIASTSAEASVRSVLHAVIGQELTERLAGVFAGDIVTAKKPAPDIYLLAVRELDLDPTRVVVVEDSATGATAAAAAGLTHIVTVSAYTAGDAFPDAAVVLSDLGEPDRPASVIRARGGAAFDLATVVSLDTMLREGSNA
jgi:HAD superfamily hydrolase (TIGR01509 family)